MNHRSRITRSLAPGALALALAACGADRPEGPQTLAAADGASIVYEVHGSGEPALVFVHCWACNRSFWREQIEAFRGDHTLVTVDLPGHGAAGRDRESWTLAAYADDVARVIDALGLERVVLVGHSMGGPVSLLAAPRLGERLEGILCVDTLHDAELAWPEEEAQQWASAFREDYEGAMRGTVAGLVPSNPEVRDWIIAEGLGADRDAMAALIEEFARFDLAAALDAVDVPVRCVNAAPYGEFAIATAVETNRRYADFDATIMEGVGHYPHLERPEEFNRHMAALLAEIAGRAEARGSE